MKAQTIPAQSESYKWLVLTISTLTFTFVVAIPQISLPVLFDEISTELNFRTPYLWEEKLTPSA